MEGKEVRRLATGIFIFALMAIYFILIPPGTGQSPEPLAQSLLKEDNHDLTTHINFTSHCEAKKITKPCVFLIDKKDQFILGERIRVGILLNYKSSTNEQADKSDILLVFARKKTKGAGSSAKVIYQGHGKYVAILQALWVGRSTIHVIIRASGAAVEKINQTLNHHSLGRNFFCYFQYVKYKEITRAFLVFNEMTGNRKQYCDLTPENYGYPLYCLQPATRELQCTDWTRIMSKERRSGEITQIQSGAVMVRLKANITVDVISRKGESSWMPSVLCGRELFKETWSKQAPVGYFFNSKWQSTHCLGVTLGNSSQLRTCLKNRTIRLLGDSTVRQLFLNLTQRLQAHIVTEDPKIKHALHRPMRAFSSKLNTTLYWGLHGIPLAYEPMFRGLTRLIHVHLDVIHANSSDIILFGIFAHFAQHNQKIFREHMKRIAKSVSSLLDRAPNVKIAIKGPHSILQPKASFYNL